MKRPTLFTSLASLFLISAGTLTNTASSAEAQEQAVPAVSPVRSRSEVVLSTEDDAVLHASFYATGAFSGGEEGQSLVGTRHRVVSFATHVTVAEAWQPSVCHAVMTVNLEGTEAVQLVGAYASPSAGGNKVSLTLEVSPLIGRNWGEVRSVDDLHFDVSALEKR